MRSIKYLFLTISLLLSISNFGQTTLIGKISNEKGNPIVNASVYLDSIKTDVVSNAVGYFKDLVPEGIKSITLHASDYGYLTTQYNKEENLSFVFLKTDGKKKDLRKVLGVPATKKNADTDMSTLNIGDDENAQNYRTIYDYIAGKVAGVTVSETNEIKIRGGSSWELSNKPLFVVDGVVVNSIDNILPSDVERISVLKGVEASIYGSRGSNGVIEITTKN